MNDDRHTKRKSFNARVASTGILLLGKGVVQSGQLWLRFYFDFLFLFPVGPSKAARQTEIIVMDSQQKVINSHFHP
jgi:hypothetical protein